MARLLNAWPAFKNWSPPDPIIKQAVVFLITGLVGGALVWLQTYAVPTYFPEFDPGLKAFLVAVAGFMLSQAVHSADVKAESH